MVLVECIYIYIYLFIYLFIYIYKWINTSWVCDGHISIPYSGFGGPRLVTLHSAGLQGTKTCDQGALVYDWIEATASSGAKLFGVWTFQNQPSQRLSSIASIASYSVHPIVVLFWGLLKLLLCELQVGRNHNPIRLCDGPHYTAAPCN